MKTIGLIGGMSWESTVTYYEVINETIKKELGGLHSAKIILYSVDFDEIEKCQAEGDWQKSAEILSSAAVSLANEIQASVHLPILHIAEATAKEINHKQLNRIALLGTKYTMTQDFYKQKLIENGIQVLIPEHEDIELVNHVIYDELCLGIINKQSKEEFIRIIHELKEKGAQGVILGCTEIGLLIQQQDSDIPVFDTTFIHAQAAALLSL